MNNLLGNVGDFIGAFSQGTSMNALQNKRAEQEQLKRDQELKRQQQFLKLDNQRQGALFQDARVVNSYLKAGQPDRAMGVLSNRVGMLEQFGGDPTDTMEIANLISNGDIKGATDLLSSVEQAGVLGGFLPQLQGEKKEKKEAFQKAEGGMVFNPNTGTYTVDPIAAQRLTEMAGSAKATGGLGFKDRQSLNKDVTGILKSTVGIKRAAEELGKLKARGSAASKLGAVFKFMKALDPTSVVRESEQGQVYSASGAAAQIAGKLNSLLGEGQLTEAGFLDLVNTSKDIADANIISVSGEVGSLLDSFEDTITSEFKSKVSARIPKPFGVSSAGKKLVKDLSDEDLFK